MRIGDTHIIVPTDETGDYPSGWRYEVALAMSETGDLPPNGEVANDPWVQAHSDYLQLNMEFYDGEVPDPALRPHHIAAKWHLSDNINDPRFRIEPLLLTGATYGIIAADTGFREDAIEAYEKLFFNTRNEDGSLKKGCYHRCRMAFDENDQMTEATAQDVVWKMAGFTLGYAGLVKLWRWDKDATGLEGSKQGVFDELWRIAQSILLNRTLRNQVNAFDLNNMMGNYIQNERMRFDTRQETGDAMAGTEIALGMLRACRPHVTEKARCQDADHIIAETERITERLAAQKAIAGEKLTVSTGAGVSAINEMLLESVRGQTS
jgi:hypothetical protein